MTFPFAEPIYRALAGAQMYSPPPDSAISHDGQMYIIEQRFQMLEKRIAALEADQPTPLVWPAIDLGELR